MPKCILIVDDDRVAVEISKKTLQKNGYEVVTACDGGEALSALQNKIPDLILLDVQMPNVDGYGFIVKKFSDPAYQKIPVIVLSAQDKTEPLFKRYGVKAYLLKPIVPQELLDKIKSIISA